MKKILIGLFLLGIFLFIKDGDVRAVELKMDKATCEGQDRVDFNGIKGIEVSAGKTAPSNPIAIGQDEDEKGVDLSITIKANAGTAYYYRWQRVPDEESKEWIYYTQKPPDGYKCDPRVGLFKLCYLERDVCQGPNETAAYRHINPNSVSVWLDPDSDTEKWLGWVSPDAGGDPLRYVFPEKWGLAAWTPSGWEHEEIGLWNPSGSQVWSFGQENSWFTYLFPDPNELVLPAQHLRRVVQPDVSNSYSGRRVLGLWGFFNVFETGYGDQTPAYACLIDSYLGPESKGSCDPVVLVNSNFTLTTSEVRFMMINIRQAPLDLPGHWRIGIIAYGWPATYYVDGVMRTEKIDIASPILQIGPAEAGYVEDKHMSYPINTYSFDSYIVISTPCLGTDPKSCVN